MTALIHRVDVEVGLEGDAEGVPRVRMPREAVQEQERGAVAAAPIEDVQLQAIDHHLAIHRTKEIHGGPHDNRIGGRSPSLDAGELSLRYVLSDTVLAEGTQVVVDVLGEYKRLGLSHLLIDFRRDDLGRMLELLDLVTGTLRPAVDRD
jgi:hypothetical protein